MATLTHANVRKLSKSDIAALFAAAVLLLYFCGTRPNQARSPMAVGTAMAFAIAAWGLGGVTLTGAVSGAVVAFIFYAIGDWRLFLILFVVFAITFLATKLSSIKT